MDDEPSIDGLAARLRAGVTEHGVLLDVLADKLEAALPGRVTVERRRRGLGRRGPVRSVAADVDRVRFTLAVDGGVLRARRAPVIGGVVASSTDRTVEELLRELAAALRNDADHEDASAAALARLLTE